MPKQNNTPAKTETAKTSPVLDARKAHDESGFTGRVYTGLSATRNAATAHTIDTTTSKARARSYAQLTPRVHATLTELATAYGNGPFLARGIDRGQAAIFLASGFLKRHATTGEHVAGVYSDGKTALKLALSADTLKRYAPAK